MVSSLLLSAFSFSSAADDYNSVQPETGMAITESLDLISNESAVAPDTEIESELTSDNPSSDDAISSDETTSSAEPEYTSDTSYDESEFSSDATTEETAISESAVTDESPETNDHESSITDITESESSVKEASSEELADYLIAGSVDYIEESDYIDIGEDSDTLLSEYMFGGSGIALISSDYNGNKLTGINSCIYSQLKPYIEQIAAAELVSTDLSLVISKDTFSALKFYASDLGITSESSKAEVDSALSKAFYQEFDMALVLRSCIRDCPYEMFWFGNKYKLGRGFKYRRETDSDGSIYYSITELSLKYRLSVSVDYADLNISDDGENYYHTDYNKMISIQNAIINANNIVAEASAMSDLEKLDYYRRQICDLVSYDYNTASLSYGNPWQIIYVFDGNPDTNVVCEGYAKSFQYLCDQSDFSSDLYVYCVSGNFKYSGSSGGGHLWNIVHYDGENYLVDLTNCDGAIPSTKLYMANPIQGSVDNGYTFAYGSARYTYTYYSDTRAIYDDSELEMPLYHEFVADPAIAPTCTEEGRTEGSHCSLCGLVNVEPQTIPMLGHTIVMDPAVAPTIDKTGLTEGSHCSVCGETIIKQLEMPALSESGWHDVGDSRYYYNDNSITTGWLYITDESSGNGSVIGHWYYFDSEGRMQTGWLYVDGDMYYLGDNGKTRTGWNIIDNEWYYFSIGGRLRYGWQYIDNDWYYLGNDGIMLTGWQYIRNGWFYFSAGGRMRTGWQYIDNIWYYMSSGGKVQTGWQYINGYWYYFSAGGKMKTGWQYIDNIWYYMSSGGKVQTGWQYINGYWYYFSAGGKMKTGWQYIDNIWYYMSSGGKVQTGWQYINGYWYYFSAGGKMKTGWQYIDNIWYYMSSGGKVQTGWQYINGYWYYFSAGGKMKTGWQYINNSWYYMYSSGKMAVGWIEINEHKYYMNPSGKMLTGWVYIDNKWYHFNSSGSMVID